MASSMYANVGTSTTQVAQPQDQKAVQQQLPTFGDMQPGGTAPTSAPQQQARPGERDGTADRLQEFRQQAQRQGGPPPTFRQWQQQGVARPAPQQYQAPWGFQPPQPAPQPQFQPPPQQPTPQFQAPGGNPQLQALLSKMMGTPTNYDDSVIQAQRTASRAGIEEGYNADKARLDEEMAARGVFGSSIAGGRLSDLMTQKNRALQAEEAGFLNQRAQAMDAGQRAAAGLGMQYEGQQADQAIRAHAMQLQARGMDQDQAFRYAQMAQQGQQFGQELGNRQYEFGANMGQRQSEFGQEMGNRQYEFGANMGQRQSEFDRNYGQRDREFAQDYGLRRDMFSEDQRQFNVSDQFRNKGLDWQMLNDLFSNYGQAELTDVVDPMAGMGQGNPGYDFPRRVAGESDAQYQKRLGITGYGPQTQPQGPLGGQQPYNPYGRSAGTWVEQTYGNQPQVQPPVDPALLEMLMGGGG